MSNDSQKQEIIRISQLLWDKDLGSVLNGNVSLRVGENRFLLTATKTCFGYLEEKDVLLIDGQGNPLEPGQASSEKRLHLDVYRNFPETTAVIHTHTNYINAYFLEHKIFTPRIFESKFWFGEIEAIPQTAPNVLDTAPVIDKLKISQIVVLGRHGVLAMGKSLFDCFLIIQGLEDAVKIECIAQAMRASEIRALSPEINATSQAPRSNSKTYDLFSQAQIDEIVRLVNADSLLGDLGAKANMTMDLAVKMQETSEVFRFHFDKGKIHKVDKDENAEFLITATREVWTSVFRREIDPFVATTQKKMILRGDFGRISKFYAPCSRLFELWTQVPVK
ncbi:MAG: class II aldolase/adducin family protein [Candidatus Omnitrophica bacterium]|nr:class II aldolase/adducin family protein [Candidatus Omnitrophota bacterium]